MFNFFKKNKSFKNIDFKSPLNGEIINIEDVEDPVFATKVLGEGIAINPTEGKVFAPINGVVETIFPTNHALGIKINNEIEILIHIGINTVELNGQFFKSYVENGSKISEGDLLIEFDLEKIKEKGYSVTTPIIVTNMADFSKLKITANGTIKNGEELFIITK